ncbi:MAG TPA: hypothetical protein VFC77_02645, partial [Myxococcota bacterium]|nr:hypothetical protein [Myxococcota bacterium]
MQKRSGPPAVRRRTGPRTYFERDPAVARVRPPPERDLLARADPVLRDELELLRDELELLRDELELLRPFDELLAVRRRLEERRVPPLRSAAGTSSRATAFASCSICRSR